MLLVIFCRIIALVLDAVLIFMLLRSLLPFFGASEDSRFMAFLFTATEPFVIPMRFILYKLNLFQNSVIDVSFTFSFLMISFISAILPIV